VGLFSYLLKKKKKRNEKDGSSKTKCRKPPGTKILSPSLSLVSTGNALSSDMDGKSLSQQISPTPTFSHRTLSLSLSLSLSL
jgi:hypothetical protein